MSRIRADRYTNRLGTGAPTFSNGVNIIGNVGVGTTVPTSSLTVKGDMNVTGTVSVGGTLSYEDVTSIDSVGVITARSGIHVTSGKVGIGTNDPLRQLDIFSTGHATAAIKGDTQSSLFFVDSGDSNIGQISYIHADNYMYFRVNDAERLRITSAGITSITGSLAVNGNNYPTAGQLSNRNLIINGSMQVAQRGTSTTSVTSSGYHAADRFHADLNAVGTWTFSQSTTSPDEFANSFKLFCTGAKASPDAGTVLIVNQRVEGFNLQSLKKGTSAAESVTLSFWVRSSKTGTYIAELRDNDNSRAISKTYSISSANTWEHKTLTFPGDTTGAFDNDNGLSLYINWWLAAGSNFTSGTLSTSWASITNANRAVGVVNLADNEDNDWYITGVQLEVGEKATPFEHRSFGDELARCQRYYQRITAQTVNARLAIGGNGSVAQCFPTAYLPTTMRAQPSVSYSAASDFKNEGITGGGTHTVSSISFDSASSHAVTIQSSASGGSGSATGAQVLSNNTNAHLAFHAEL